MIKKICKNFLTFCVIGLGLINFSSAVDYVENLGYNYYNPFSLNIYSYGNVDYNITSKGDFSTTYNSITYDKFLYFRDGYNNPSAYFILGRKNGKLYGFVNTYSSSTASYRNNLQGYFDKFEIVQTGYNFSYNNSNMYSLTISIDDAINYLNSNNIIGFHGSNGNDKPNKTYAKGNFMNFALTYISDWCIITDNETNPYLCFFHSSLSNNQSNFKPNLTGSLDFSVNDYSNMASFVGFFDNSPITGGGSGGGGEGGEDDGGDDNSTVISIDEGVIYATCNRGTAVRRYEKNGYNVRLCYGGIDNYDIWDGGTVGTLPIYGTGKDFRDIWNNTQNYYQGGITGDNQNLLAWFSYRRQLYDIYKRGGYSTNPFVNTPLVMFTYFGAVDVYGNSKNNRDILEYCNLKLYASDYSVEYKGVNESSVCSLTNLVEDSLNNVSDRVDDLVNGTGGSQGTGGTGGIGGIGGSSGTIIGFNTNDILSGSQGTGGTGGSGGSEGNNGNGGNTIVDGRDFITQFVDDFKQNIGNVGNNGNGFLPGYIIVALMGIILFNFLRH